ncbi:MAG: hypothetical protein Q4F34_09215, partial [Prevotellaceae bacterium]|nr:hypothetical protein [Prevotellaceae bacterium]
TTTAARTVGFDKYDFVAGVGGNTHFNLGADIHRSPVSIFGLNALYAGGYQGVVVGNTHMYAGGGLHYDVFGGASNADIYGYAETFVGSDRFGRFTNNLQLRHCVYGGNDFGGQILGTGTHTILKANPDGTTTTQDVTSNTFVKYLGGNVERSIFGGSCGLYRYRDTYINNTGEEMTVTIGSQEYKLAANAEVPLYPQESDLVDVKGVKLANSWESMPTLFTDLMGEYNDETNTYANPNNYNIVVDIACENEVTPNVANGIMSNQIFANIYGGGYGYCDETGRVDAHNTYVNLHGPENGTQHLAENVFGGGYFSYVEHSKVDAYSGLFRNIYGGTYGTTVDAGVSAINHAQLVAQAATQTSTWGTEFDPNEYQVLEEIDATQLKEADYTGLTAEVNVYPKLTANSGVNIYGAGSYTGVDETVVNLYGGLVNEVYGGSKNEGVCRNTLVNVPAGSKISMAALYGGAYGSYPALPCDVRNATIRFSSSDAIVRDGMIFGGNNNCRATHNAVINYDAKAKDSNGEYLTLFGAGNGQNSVAGNAHVFVSGSSILKNIYGGSQAGRAEGCRLRPD